MKTSNRNGNEQFHHLSRHEFEFFMRKNHIHDKMLHSRKREPRFHTASVDSGNRRCGWGGEGLESVG